MALYDNANTPGVKLVEKSILPPSVVQVSTAIPVFLGYAAGGVTGEPFRITSLKEYEDHFKDPSTGEVGKKYTFGFTGSVGSISVTAPAITHFLYEAIQLYFMNGGGPCYIIKVGDLSTTVSADHFNDPVESWVKSIEKLDEPTLISFPELALETDIDKYAGVVNAALNLCKSLKDKFVIVDPPFNVDLTDLSQASIYRGKIAGAPSYGATYYPSLKTVAKVNVDETNFGTKGTAEYLEKMNLVSAINRVELPASSLMAGVYAKVDRERGVWKAPANVALQGVIEPTVPVSDADQHELNVDATSGKSINAIRQFVGKGTVVWGARTLDGNNNEWRYVNVRRLFITVEESVSKAVAQFVFENNDAKTWAKVSSMIKSYLNGLWKDGALTGASAEEAYFVEVGLGTTMSQQDILEGKMIVRIGLAAVRPAEFIILEFSHFVNQ